MMIRVNPSLSHRHRIIDMKRALPPTAAQIRLGEHLQKLREHKNITRKQVGKKVKVPEQQIAKYEAGAFVPMAMLEDITKFLGEPIAKKIIRRISLLRKKELAEEIEIEELNDLYDEAFDAEYWD